jgi:26S proteasome regulatory subunit N7
MASAFGVSPDFMDGELSQFIASGRLNCKIDRVAGVLETTRPDVKSAHYASVLKAGDLLLGRIQAAMRVD